MSKKATVTVLFGCVELSSDVTKKKSNQKEKRNFETLNVD